MQNNGEMRFEFRRFLMNSGALYNFLDRVKATGIEESRIVRYDTPYDYILKSFIWEDTPEGFTYWSELNDNWYALLKKIGNR